MIRRPLVLVALFALGACIAQERAAGPRFASLDAAVPAVQPRQARPTPVVVLPAWIGRPVSLRERDAAGGFEQAITLPAAGRRAGRDDLILVSTARDASLDAVPGGKPTEAGIRAEIAAAFPGVAMQVVTRPSSNAYGPYGLAIGRAGAARCLYAWQWIPEAPVREEAAPTPLSLRLRLCRDDLTFEAMAAAVSQLRLVPRFSGEPVVGPATAGARPVRHARPTQPASRQASRQASQQASQRASWPAQPGPAPSPVFAASPPEPTPAGPRYLGAESVARGPAASGLPVRTVLLGALDTPAPVAAGLPADAAILPPEATRGPAAPRP